MAINDLTLPYDVIQHEGIAYSVCKEFDYISRYRNLRQVVHTPNSPNRYVTFETPNPIVTNNLPIIYHVVDASEANRLDIIANRYLGSASYSWVIAYFNQIEDGYSVFEGQTIIIPKSITDLFAEGEILASVTALKLNLGEE